MAKAGKKKEYGKPVYTADGRAISGVYKAKDWGAKGQGYVIDSNNYSLTVCKEQWKTGDPVLVPRKRDDYHNQQALTEAEMSNRMNALGLSN